MDSPISRAEHIEFVKRMEEEDHRQNRRLDQVEKDVKEIQKLTASVSSLAKSVEEMVCELGKQGERLDALEQKPAENWNTVTRAILNGLGAAIAGAVLGAIAMFFIK